MVIKTDPEFLRNLQFCLNESESQIIVLNLSTEVINLDETATEEIPHSPVNSPGPQSLQTFDFNENEIQQQSMEMLRERLSQDVDISPMETEEPTQNEIQQQQTYSESLLEEHQRLTQIPDELWIELHQKLRNNSSNQLLQVNEVIVISSQESSEAESLLLPQQKVTAEQQPIKAEGLTSSQIETQNHGNQQLLQQEILPPLSTNQYLEVNRLNESQGTDATQHLQAEGVTATYQCYGSKELLSAVHGIETVSIEPMQEDVAIQLQYDSEMPSLEVQNVVTTQYKSPRKSVASTKLINAETHFGAQDHGSVQLLQTASVIDNSQNYGSKHVLETNCFIGMQDYASSQHLQEEGVTATSQFHGSKQLLTTVDCIESDSMEHMEEHEAIQSQYDATMPFLEGQNVLGNQYQHSKEASEDEVGTCARSTTPINANSCFAVQHQDTAQQLQAESVIGTLQYHGSKQLFNAVECIESHLENDAGILSQDDNAMPSLEEGNMLAEQQYCPEVHSKGDIKTFSSSTKAAVTNSHSESEDDSLMSSDDEHENLTEPNYQDSKQLLNAEDSIESQPMEEDRENQSQDYSSVASLENENLLTIKCETIASPSTTKHLDANSHLQSQAYSSISYPEDEAATELQRSKDPLDTETLTKSQNHSSKESIAAETLTPFEAQQHVRNSLQTSKAKVKVKETQQKISEPLVEGSKRTINNSTPIITTPQTHNATLPFISLSPPEDILIINDDDETLDDLVELSEISSMNRAFVSEQTTAAVELNETEVLPAQTCAEPSLIVQQAASPMPQPKAAASSRQIVLSEINAMNRALLSEQTSTAAELKQIEISPALSAKTCTEPSLIVQQAAPLMLESIAAASSKQNRVDTAKRATTTAIAKTRKIAQFVPQLTHQFRPIPLAVLPKSKPTAVQQSVAEAQTPSSGTLPLSAGSISSSSSSGKSLCVSELLAHDNTLFQDSQLVRDLLQPQEAATAPASPAAAAAPQG